MVSVTLPLCVLVALSCMDQAYGNRALRRMFPDRYPPMLRNGVDPGQPVFLTPYIEKGQFDTGIFK